MSLKDKTFIFFYPSTLYSCKHEDNIIQKYKKKKRTTWRWI